MVNSSIRRRLAAIARDPGELDEPSPLHLGAFFEGYASIVKSIRWLDHALTERIPAPPLETSAWYRAHLQDNPLDGLLRLLRIADELLASNQESSCVEFPPESSWWVTLVADVVRQRRIGMILGECSLAWLHNYGLGADAALHDHFPMLAAESNQRFSGFERWLQESYTAPGAPWHRIVRVFYGPGEGAVQAFGAAWDEYSARASETRIVR